MPRSSFVPFLLVFSMGCALLACGDDGVGSCTVTVTSGSETEILMCEEVPGNLKGQLRQTCAAAGSSLDADAGAPVARYADGPCSHEGALGACKMSAGPATMTIWYYANGSDSRTSDDLKAFCETAGYTYVAP